MLHIVWLMVGLVLLTVGGEYLVRGALSAAQRLGVSSLLIGLVVVGFGTSAPELVVSLQAALNDSPDIAVGNVIGSNIANILLILGISACIMPLVTSPACLKRDGLTMILATLLFMGMASLNGLSRIEGVIMLIALAAYVIWAYRSDRHATLHAETIKPTSTDTSKLLSPLLTMVAIVGGLAMLIVGANRFLLGAIGLGEMLGIPEVIIGLTVVAVGTSLPEMAVSIIAAIRKEADVAIGNIVGSNIFNILCILGIASVITPLPLAGRMLTIDQFVMLGAAVALVVFLYFGLRLSRLKGFVLLVAYVAYVAAMFGLQN